MLPSTPIYVTCDERDQEIFQTTVPADHYLRRVLAVIDFEQCRAELACCYSPTQGRPAIEPLLLLKLEFLQYHYNLSDRQVTDQAHYNMAFRLFLGLSLHSSLPHHTLLTVFRERLGTERHQKLFDLIVAQAREHGLVKDRLRLKDATHLVANIAIPSTVRLVAQTRQRVLDAVRPYAPERVATEEARAEVIRTTTADLSGEERLLQRVTHLREIVAWVEDLVTNGSEEGAPRPGGKDVTEALALAHKVLADRADEKGVDHLVSVHDTDARKGNHHGPYTGYLLDVTVDADSDLIAAINVLPASGNEVQDATTLIRHEQQVHGNKVHGLSIDALGCRGEQLREWTDPNGLNLDVTVPPRQGKKPLPGYFDDSQFTPSSDGMTVTCPAGQISQQRRPNRHRTGWTFRWAKGTCAACPLAAQCLPHLHSSYGRHVSTNDYAAEYAAVRAKAQTPAYQEIRKQHRRVERKLSDLVRWHRARRARYRGNPRVLLQALLTGLVVNVKCLVRHLTAPTVRAVVAETG
jgi:IS5 family transposase